MKREDLADQTQAPIRQRLFDYPGFHGEKGFTTNAGAFFEQEIW